MSLKNCSNCNKLKPPESFSNYKKSEDGLRFHCKACDKIKKDAYRFSKKGLIAHIYSHQLSSSRHRKHCRPTYSLVQLREWLAKQPNFDDLYKNWVVSGYAKHLTPSVDRRDDYKPYTIENLLRVCTWKENCDRAHSDRKNGINNKRSKTVIQLTLDGHLIRNFYSIMQAERETGIFQANISKCCLGQRNSAGGFKWSYL